MEEKTVRGITRNRLMGRCFDVSMDKALPPGFVDAWVKWFDEMPDDKAAPQVTEVKRPFEAGDLDAVASGCGHCPNAAQTVCADDCPPPEYYAADLEEVAAMQTSRIEAALIQLVGVNNPMADSNGNHRAAPAWLSSLFVELQNEIKTPGYVAGLIPE
ncbi:hypothetical protein [Buttiauxella sp. A111]|uniref:hypothetical protein n=1 Tax=Buttiauxella sp. A111 TaxID=2563088 RepID=UPI0010D9B93E|nr:hypothetical protein [Buttiauxella sp. A111]GDX06326.1 hypothetical protein BSPA111_25350 [Buttiauxella sp. A111]